MQNRRMIRAALVDFGDTLVDQTFMFRDCDRFPTWTVVYGAVVREHLEAWETGRMSSAELAVHIAARLDAPPADVHAYMGELCRGLRFFPVVNEAMRRRRQRGGTQALVTVNTDVVDDIAVHYGLLDVFDLVVSSSHHGTVSKTELCHRALDLLGGLDPTDTVLVDNLPENVEGWIACGGQGYLFRDDATFAGDVRAGRVPGFVASDV